MTRKNIRAVYADSYVITSSYSTCTETEGTYPPGLIEGGLDVHSDDLRKGLKMVIKDWEEQKKKGGTFKNFSLSVSSLIHWDGKIFTPTDACAYRFESKNESDLYRLYEEAKLNKQ